MKFEIKGFLETSFLDWPGRMAAVTFLPRCNFRCPYCHNRELVTDGGRLPTMPLSQILERIRTFSGWIDSVVVSGGEPTIHPHLPELLGRLRSAGLSVKLDTNGSRPEVLAAVVEGGLVQAVDMDLKAPLRPESYARLAGVPVEVGDIRASLEILKDSGIPHRFRTTYVPGLLEPEEVRDLVSQLSPSSVWSLQGFSPRRVLDQRLETVAPPPPEELDSLRQLFVSSPPC